MLLGDANGVDVDVDVDGAAPDDAAAVVAVDTGAAAVSGGEDTAGERDDDDVDDDGDVAEVDDDGDVDEVDDVEGDGSTASYHRSFLGSEGLLAAVNEGDNASADATGEEALFIPSRCIVLFRLMIMS